MSVEDFIKKFTNANPNDNAVGQNGMSARSAFYQRSLYRDVKYPETRPQSLDIWHDKLLYGRVDRRQRAIVPLSSKLTSVRSGNNPNMMLLSPVEIAFEKFSLHMKKAITMGAVNTSANPALLNLKAVRAYQSPQTGYSDFTQRLYGNFARNVTAKENKNIVDFSSFLYYYKNYLLTIAKVTPVTFGNYVLSSHCSSFSSGLAVSLAKDDPGSDAEKVEKYLQDPNFEFFRNCAKKFGFIVNKNMPWVLTADLFTEAFVETGAGNLYVSTTGAPITKDNFFSVFYTHACLDDMSNLITILMNSYKLFIEEQPYYDSSPTTVVFDRERETLGNACPVVAKPRQPLIGTVQDIILNKPGSNEILSPKELIDFYIDIKNAEVKNAASAQDISQIRQLAYRAYKTAPVTAQRYSHVGAWVDRAFSPVLYGSGAQEMQIRTFLKNLRKTLDNGATSATITEGSNQTTGGNY